MYSADQSVHYVGIGASAGGLEAIETFFARMPEDSGLVFIVIQHLSPDYKSLMVELLSKKTRIPVHRSEDGMEVKPNNIYMIPPKKNLTIFHGKLILKEKDQVRGVNLPIDIFLRSLAEDKADKAIAIILSGTGSDGTRGVRAIKENGGMVMVQEESTAKFDGMPRAAISTGMADFILPPEEMAEQLVGFLKHRHLTGQKLSDRLLRDEHGMTRIFSELRARTKVDFTYYKPSTISRRIERRMTVNQIDTLDDYVRYIQRYPAEIMTLYRELLIGVTSFFRDPEAMAELKTQCLPEIIRKIKDREIRFWITGCSTGEEAYTIAILAKETMAELGITRDIKIFATDIDRDAIMQAGNGIYPESIAADLTHELLGKYFYKKEENYQVARHIREMVVFAQHNLVKDPPFTKIDLISCRNLLIYLQPVLQKKALNMFNFSLNSGGILFLGTSETIGEMTDSFETIHQKFKIYRATGRHQVRPSLEKKTYSEDSPSDAVNLYSIRGHREYHRDSGNHRMMERYLEVLETRYVPLSVVVNEEMTVIHIFGDTSQVFRVPSGRMVYDITRMARKDLAIPLATGIQKVFRTKEELLYNNVRFTHGGETRNVTLRIVPLPDKKGFDSLVAVFFETITVEKDRDTQSYDVYDLEEDVQQRIRDLEQELQFARENLQATIEELETSNEELQATNEELLASNEELQSTNEELQSTNEELFTVNAEYQNKIIELTEMNNDVENLLSSSGVGILILDENNEIRKYSPRISEIFNVLEKDVGRPISHISHRILGFDPLETAKTVQKNNTQVAHELQDDTGVSYLIRVLPYHIGQDAYSGTIFTFVDISELTRVKQDLKISRRRSKDILQHMPSGLFIYRRTAQDTLILEDSNFRAQELTGLNFKESRGMSFKKLWPVAEKQEIQEQFLNVFETREPLVIKDMVYEDDRISGHYRVSAFLLPEDHLAVIFDDISHEITMEKQLGAVELKYTELFEQIRQGVVYQDRNGQIISANPAAREILGLTLDQMKNKTSMDPDWKVINQAGEDLSGDDHPSMVSLREGRAVTGFIMGVYHPKKKAHRWLRVDAVPEFRNGETEPFQVFTMFEDITHETESAKTAQAL
ncbi:MAG: chemotaxis protein CheB [Desulfobacteraceae bacterium]